MSNNFVTPWTTACQAPLSLGFPRQEYSCGLPFPFPRYLPNPEIKPESPALAGKFFTASHWGNPLLLLLHSLNALYSAPGTLLSALQELSSLSLLTTTEIVGIPPNLACQTDTPGKLPAQYQGQDTSFLSSIKVMATCVCGE